MNEGPKCACCKTAPATLVVTEPTDACERGTLYCDSCSTATCAGMERLASADDRSDRIAHLATQRGQSAENALDAIGKLTEDLKRMALAIRTAEAGEAIRTGDLTPYHQTMQEVVSYGVEYRTLWNAVGLLAR